MARPVQLGMLGALGADDAAGAVGISCPLIFAFADLTGLGLFPSFASSLLGSEMGRGMRDFPSLLDRAPPLEHQLLLALHRRCWKPTRTHEVPRAMLC